MNTTNVSAPGLTLTRAYRIALDSGKEAFISMYKVLLLHFSLGVCLLLGIMRCTGGTGERDTAADLSDSSESDSFWTLDSADGSDIEQRESVSTEFESSMPDVNGPTWNTNWRFAYVQRGRTGLETEGYSDLFIWNAGGLGTPWSMSYGIEEESGEPALDCNYACVLNDSLTWLAVATGPPDLTTGTYTFQLGQIDSGLIAHVQKGGALADIVDLHFGGDYLYYTQIEQCEATWCTYAFWRMNLSNVTLKEKLMLFPTAQDLPAGSNQLPIYKGHFTVSNDGQALAILLPTIRSQSVFLWKNGQLQQLDYVCSQMQNGECVGAGSEYSDLDPLAISPDGRWIAAFSIAEKELRISLYDALHSGVARYSVLAAVSTGTYLAQICEPGELQPWQRATVAAQPRFSSDATRIYFLGKTDCGLDKPRTDIFGIDIGKIGQGVALTASDLVNVTGNVDSDGPDNVVFSSFDLSPDDLALVLAGTATFQQNGQIIEAGSSRHKKDTEIWVIGMDRSGKRQMTNDSSWSVYTPNAYPPAP